ncbi:MAG: cell division protein ZapA [Sphingomonadales bacterium]|nr:cell division protein ZapA [Sphingomonadales bacterium]MBU3992274.1 cell division protein ZapA [Alphaproteobacteria bacterium]
MSNVNLHIGGRSFTVACAAGEEAHISGLGRMIDDKLHAMGGAGNQNETRMLLFAALLLADELHETAGGAGAPVAPVPAPAEDPALAERLEEIAAKLELCASHLEGLAGDA